MGNNAALKELNLSDYLKKQSEIEYIVESREHIFELKENENELGFISLEDLKTVYSNLNFESANIRLRNIDSTEWKLIYEFPYFQRRKPQIVQSTPIINSEEENLYLLVKGQKIGPFSKETLENKLNNKEILLTDLISLNAGHTWQKIYQVNGFDRRNLKENESLPGLPDSNFFEVETNEKPKDAEEIEAVTGLAYLGNLKRGKAIEREKEDQLDAVLSKNAQSSNIYRWIFTFSIIGIIYLIYNLNHSLKKTPFENSDESHIGEKRDKNTLGESNSDQITPLNTNMFQNNNNNTNNDLRRNAKFDSRQLNPVRRVSRRPFSSTDKFKNAQGEQPGEMGTNENYYYNDATPIELDPVRSQVSKETSELNAPIGEPGPAPINDPLFNQEVDN